MPDDWPWAMKLMIRLAIKSLRLYYIVHNFTNIKDIRKLKLRQAMCEGSKSGRNFGSFSKAFELQAWDKSLKIEANGNAISPEQVQKRTGEDQRERKGKLEVKLWQKRKRSQTHFPSVPFPFGLLLVLKTNSSHLSHKLDNAVHRHHYDSLQWVDWMAGTAMGSIIETSSADGDLAESTKRCASDRLGESASAAGSSPDFSRVFHDIWLLGICLEILFSYTNMSYPGQTFSSQTSLLSLSVFSPDECLKGKTLRNEEIIDESNGQMKFINCRAQVFFIPQTSLLCCPQAVKTTWDAFKDRWGS